MIFQDSIIEKCLSRINDSNNSNNKLLNYKKAVNRLNELKDEYNVSCKRLKAPIKKSKSKNIDKIITDAEMINDEISNNDDLSEIIDKYIDYRDIVINMKDDVEKIKNNFNIVKESMDDFELVAFDISEII
jgi:hypothetical protein